MITDTLVETLTAANGDTVTLLCHQVATPVSPGVLHGTFDVGRTAARDIALGFALVNLACGVLALIPIPPLEMGVIVWSRIPRTPGPRRKLAGDLSERELAVLRLLPGEESLREIASTLYLSLNTVKTHSRSIYRKLGAASREQAVERGREIGLLEKDPEGD